MLKVITSISIVSLCSLTAAAKSSQFFIKVQNTINQTDSVQIQNKLQDLGAKVTHKYEIVDGLWLADISNEKLETAMKEAQEIRGVVYVEKSHRRKVTAFMNFSKRTSILSGEPELPIFEEPPTTWNEDPKIASNYGTGQNLTRKAWKKHNAYGNPQTIIAVIDTGVDYTHDDLRANMWRNPGEIPNNNLDDDNNGYIDDVVGYDFANNDPLPFDDHDHGTHVAGIAAAVGGNGKGIAGHCPRCSIMALKFITSDGSGTDADAIKAIEYATKMGAVVANSSWGSPQNSKSLEEAFNASAAKGLIHVVAAGNEGRDLANYSFYPAKFKSEGQLTVAALYPANIYIPFWSNHGRRHVHTSCGGSEVYSTLPGNTYGSYSGTSMAAPGIAGDVALMLSHSPDISNAKIHSLLDKYSIGDRSSISKTKFSGRPNMLKVFNAL